MRAQSRSPTWQQALLLLVGGALVCYASFENLDIWGAGVSHLQPLWFLGFAAGLLAFISGFTAFLWIAAKVLTSSRESQISAETRSEPPTQLAGGYRGVPVQRQTSREKIAPAHRYLRIALIATVIFEALSAWHWGAPSLSSVYGRYYWWTTALQMLLTQVPFVVALVRMWPSADRSGMVLAIVASAGLVVFTVRAFVKHGGIPLEPWPCLAAVSAFSVITLGGLVWRSLPRSKGDVALIVSISFGFAAYTVLTQVAMAILRARMRP